MSPAEDVWNDKREKFFGNLVFNSMNAVEKKLIEPSLFYENNPKVIKSIVDFDWIVNTL